MSSAPPLLTFLLIAVSGWVHRHQLLVTEFLHAGHQMCLGPFDLSNKRGCLIDVRLVVPVRSKNTSDEYGARAASRATLKQLADGQRISRKAATVGGNRLGHCPSTGLPRDEAVLLMPNETGRYLGDALDLLQRPQPVEQ